MKRRHGLGDVSAEQRDEQTFPGVVGRDSPNARSRENERNRILTRKVPRFVNKIVQNNRSYIINGTSRRVLPANKNRRYLLIVNTGADTIFVSFGSASTTVSSIPVLGGGNYEPWVVANSEVHIRTLGGLDSVAVVSESFESDMD